MIHTVKWAVASVFSILIATNAQAQKPKDTLRVAINNPFVSLSQYHVPVDEASNFYRDIYESLLSFDEYNQKFVPMLAQLWTRVSPTVLEFDLKPGITFHNGNKFDADDVVATINFLIDPKAKLTYPTRYNWIEKVEKLSPTKVRIQAKQPTGIDLSLLAYHFAMWDAETMAKHEDLADYGRLTPVGTGVYKAVYIDRNKGVAVERNETYATNKEYNDAPVRRVEGIPLPDKQTQVAQLIAGGVDLLRNVQPDMAKELSANPSFVITNVPSQSLFNFIVDSTGRSGNAALSDPRVRRAMFMAIDRNAIMKYIVPGGEIAEKLDAQCFKTTIGCAYSVKPPTYDPAGAKKLLAEAGYPDGFEFTYDVYAPNRPIGEAVAGDLRKVGIRANVNPVDITVFRRRQGDGKLNAWSVLFPTGNHPDVANILGVMFGPASFAYIDDDIVAKGMEAGEREFDLEKRKDIYRTVFNRINEMSYVLTISSVPTVYAHSKDVKISRDKLSGETYISDYSWK